MDEFLMRLDVSAGADIEELPRQFQRILSWMSVDPYSEPDSSTVSALLRGALFLYGNLEVHGQALEQKLRDDRSIPRNELNTLLSKFHAGSFLPDICEQLLMTVTGPNHIQEIQNFCIEFLDTHQFTKILSKVREARVSQETQDRVEKEARFLMISAFQMESADIELMIQRILDSVEFDILAWIINTRNPLTYFGIKCLIVQKELCSRLESGDVSTNFIASMFKVSSMSEDGLNLYFKCLRNEIFASSLMTFCIKFMSTIEVAEPNPEQEKFMKHDLHHVSFLTAGMMSSRADCRIEFYKKLSAMSVSINVVLSISHLNFVYDF